VGAAEETIRALERTFEQDRGNAELAERDPDLQLVRYLRPIRGTSEIDRELSQRVSVLGGSARAAARRDVHGKESRASAAARETIGPQVQRGTRICRKPLRGTRRGPWSRRACKRSEVPRDTPEKGLIAARVPEPPYRWMLATLGDVPACCATKILAASSAASLSRLSVMS
jgi:hypothetical protein